jgi:hypothetical protein
MKPQLLSNIAGAVAGWLSVRSHLQIVVAVAVVLFLTLLTANVALASPGGGCGIPGC